MSFAEILLLLIGLAAAFRVSWRLPCVSVRNWTAVALTASYLVVQGTWLFTGLAFPIIVMVMLDATVIAVIYAKPPAFDCWPYQDRWHQLRAFLLELSLWDRAVLFAFPAAWIGYAIPLSDHRRWWLLYSIALAQFIAAGIEAFQSSRASRPAKAGLPAPGDSPPSLRFAGGWGYG